MGLITALFGSGAEFETDGFEEIAGTVGDSARRRFHQTPRAATKAAIANAATSHERLAFNSQSCEKYARIPRRIHGLRMKNACCRHDESKAKGSHLRYSTLAGLIFVLLANLFFWTLTATAQSNLNFAYTFTTLSGKAKIGSDDGVGDTAQFNFPRGIALDVSGNIYIADTDNHTIRKVTAAGVVSTLAGFAGLSGTNDGTGASSRFNSPWGICVDGGGNLYVTDSGNSTVRMLTPRIAGSQTNWIVTTIAGLAGNFGSSDGLNDSARFDFPRGIATDASGSVLYVADSGYTGFGCTIRKVNAVGTNWSVSTFAGLAGNFGSQDGTGTNAQFRSPWGLALDTNGNVFVADVYLNSIRKISSAGTVSTINLNETLIDPSGIAVDGAGNLYVTEQHSVVRKITPLGVVSTLAGRAFFPEGAGSADGTGTGAEFSFPIGIVANSTGNLFVADGVNGLVRKITPAGVVTTVAGAKGSDGSTDGTGSNARFRSPGGIAVDSSGTATVVDCGNNTIRTISSAGVVSTLAGSAVSFGTNDGVGNTARFGSDGPDYYQGPYGVAVDSQGNAYVADKNNNSIRRITPSGVVTTIAGFAGWLNTGTNDGVGSAAKFNWPKDITVDFNGNLFVTDSLNHTIRKIGPTTFGGQTNWVVTTIAGLAANSGTNDGDGREARFDTPAGITVDIFGNLYVADSYNQTIRKIAPTVSAGQTNWIVSTIAGAAGSSGSANGIGSEARFSYPAGIAIDAAGNLFVADSGGPLIRKLTPFGTNMIVSTIGGLAQIRGANNGSGSNARFFWPNGIAVDGYGNLYVTDENNTIRKGVFTQYGAANTVPYNQPPMNCQLIVTLLPSEGSGQWRFPWEFGWHNSGATVSNLVAGNYPIEFRSLSGWLAAPFGGPVTLGSGETVAVTNQYYPTLSSIPTNGGGGSLTVFLGVNPPAGAGWRFLGDTTPFFGSGYTTNLPIGTYLIEFAAVSGRAKPSSQAVQVQSGQPTYVSVSYLLATTPNGNFYLPFAVPTNQVSEEITFPFGFNGQLQSDVGYGSGVAVANNVVLTAAHLAFNDQSLSYVSRAHWFFRRNAGVSEPMPQTARGFYLLSGYAAQRTNDLQSGYSPDQSTPPSRNVDVAALYFLQPVAGGGHGGYLPSDAVPNTWLTSTALKMLVGYPVDGSQFGVNVVPGKMYQTDPQPYPLGLATDPVPGQQQIYTAPWFLSYPGNSGGPLYVQLNGQYYPTAVYLGTLFSGSTPYASIVRAIDSDVVRLITNAATMGDSGTNNTGGGVITIIPNQSISVNSPGYLQLHLGPSSAVQAGAGWRLQGDPTYSAATNYTRLVSSTNTLAVEFKPLPGWNLPISQSVTVLPGQLTSFNAIYTVVPPVMLADPTGIRITGTPNTTYRIERMNVGAGATQWMGISTNTLTTGTNTVVSLPQANPSAALYRAVWLPGL